MIINRVFWLMVLLIAVAYFVGLSTDINVLSRAFVRVGYMLTGRTEQGQFAGYPTGATLAN